MDIWRLEGMPTRMICFSSGMWIRRSLGMIFTHPAVFSSWIVTSRAEVHWDRAVAMATPATPMSNLATSITSSTAFMQAQTTR